MTKIAQQKHALAEQLMRESAYSAVLQVLSEHGFERLTVQRVARAANLATGTLYNYFKDKDDLMVYTAVRLFERIRQRQREAVEPAKTPAAKLDAYLKATLTYFSENIAYFDFLDQAQIYCKIDMAIKHDHVDQENRLLAGIVRAGIQRGDFKAVHPKKTATFFQRAIVGTLCMVPELGEFNPTREAASLLKMFHVYLTPPTK